MKHEQILNEVFSALEKKNWEQVNKHLTENFTFSGALPTPIKKDEWVGVQRAIQSGMPDLKFNLHRVIVKGDKILTRVKLAGTHTAELPAAPLINSAAIPITWKKVELPEEELVVTFTGDKISQLYVKPVENGGVQGILDQLKEEDKGVTDYLE